MSQDIKINSDLRQVAMRFQDFIIRAVPKSQEDLMAIEEMSAMYVHALELSEVEGYTDSKVKLISLITGIMNGQDSANEAKIGS